ncbi:MAG: hypothetical protein HFG60_09700 [Lachnospiraceae bacterium]|nr:hypothetical protein [Lachnospiraceae bacterium]MCI9184938.1 hypothetical protein [Lachnospiraceae bacterium]
MVRCLNCMGEHEELLPSCPYCGWKGMWRKGDWLEPGTILQGRYILGTLRSRNEADILYIGWDALFNRKVLLTEYFPQSCVDRGGDGLLHGEPAMQKVFSAGIKTFCNTGKRLIMLDDTKGLLNVYSVFEENGTAYMAMEYPGELTLREALLERGALSLESTEELVRCIAVPLSSAHGMHFCHGNLSLDCCYQVAPGKYKVGGFNEAAYLTGDVPDVRGKAKGRMAPDPGRDVYQLAWITGCALMGVEEWEDCSVEENLALLGEDLPEYVVDALTGALKESPSGGRITVRRFLDLFVDEATVEILPQPEPLDSEMKKGPKNKKNRGLINILGGNSL